MNRCIILRKENPRKEQSFKRKITLFVMSLLILFFIASPLLVQHFIVSNDNSTKKVPNKDLRTSDFWVLPDPIYIDDLGVYNWTWARTQEWCTKGDGSEGNPYVIENITINGDDSDSCIEIRNSNAHFIVKNCTLFNSPSGLYAGILLLNVSNGQIVDNNCSYNQGVGIYLLQNSSNNTILGNNVSNNNYGIRINDNCDHNNISENTVNNNEAMGVFLNSQCNNNTISENMVNENYFNGIYLELNCDNNTISNNTVNDNINEGITLSACSGAILYDNQVHNGGYLFTGSITQLSTHNIDPSNKVDGKSLYYYVNKIGLKSNNFSDAGEIILINCTHSTISEKNITNSFHGIYLHSSSHNNISKNNINNSDYGIHLYNGCKNNTISGNNVSYSRFYGIYLDYRCENNTISENQLEYNNYGIHVYNECNNNTVSGNTARYSVYYGINIQFTCHNNRILGNNATNNDNGIYIWDNCENNTISGNNANNNDYGIYIYDDCINTIVSGNTVRDSDYCGIYSSSCLGLNLFDNKIYGGGLYVTGSGSIDYLNTHKINISNIVNDKPFYYYVNQIGLKSDNFSNAGQIMLINCSHSVISRENITNTYAAIHLYSSSDNNITENHIYNHQFGIYLHQNCENNAVSENNISYNYRGIYLNSYCDNNTFSENNASYNNNGFYIIECDNNSISGNYIDNNNFYGIYSYKGSYNFLLGNTINYNGRGIYFIENCVNNSVVGNNISYNTVYGINLDIDCEYSLIYLNIITQNGVNGIDYGTNNQWDNGSRGNLWSDYVGLDEALPYGIGDSFYDLSGTAGAQDRYPLIDTTLRITFIVNISCISEGQIIQFTFTGAGGFGPISFYWDFGDGSNSTDRNPQHQYLVQGNFTVVLEVTDFGGYQSTYEITIEVTPNDDNQGNQDRQDQEDPTMIIITTVVASVSVGGVATAASYSVYHAKQATTQASKIAKKKIKGKKSTKHGKNVKQLKQPIKSSKEILSKLSNKDELLKIFQDDVPLGQVSGISEKPLTTVSNEFLTNVDKLGLSPAMKEDFLREILSFSPSERIESLDGMLIDLKTVPPVLEEKKKEDILVYEDLTLELIQEYVEKHKQFDPVSIVSYLNSRFSKASINVNVNGIKKIIRSLIEKNLIIEGSILTKDDMLNNNNRKKIYSCVSKNPGIHFNKLVKKTKIARVVVRWHINMLIKFQFIRMEQIGNHHAYFDNESKHQDLELTHFIFREKSKKIIEYLELNDDGCLLTELSNDLGMHYNTIKKYINKLEEYKIISSKNKKFYYLNEKVLAGIRDSSSKPFENDN